MLQAHGARTRRDHAGETLTGDRIGRKLSSGVRLSLHPLRTGERRTNSTPQELGYGTLAPVRSMRCNGESETPRQEGSFGPAPGGAASGRFNHLTESYVIEGYYVPDTALHASHTFTHVIPRQCSAMPAPLLVDEETGTRGQALAKIAYGGPEPPCFHV